jgi:hypothetical protein
MPRADETVLDDLKRQLDIRRSPEGIITGRPVIPTTGFAAWKFNNPPDGVVIFQINPDP